MYWQFTQICINNTLYNTPTFLYFLGFFTATFTPFTDLEAAKDIIINI